MTNQEVQQVTRYIRCFCHAMERSPVFIIIIYSIMLYSIPGAVEPGSEAWPASCWSIISCPLLFIFSIYFPIIICFPCFHLKGFPNQIVTVASYTSHLTKNMHCFTLFHAHYTRIVSVFPWVQFFISRIFYLILPKPAVVSFQEDIPCCSDLPSAVPAASQPVILLLGSHSAWPLTRLLVLDFLLPTLQPRVQFGAAQCSSVQSREASLLSSDHYMLTRLSQFCQGPARK